jgi:hypothetical protein
MEVLDHANRLFPSMCYFEGWGAPSRTNWNAVIDDNWSDDNPLLKGWRALEAELCRLTDMTSALMLAEGVDLRDIGLHNDVINVEMGQLSRLIGTRYMKEHAEMKFEEIFGDLKLDD